MKIRFTRWVISVATLGSMACADVDLVEPEETVAVIDQSLVRPKLTFGVRAQDCFQADWTATMSGATGCLPNAWDNARGFHDQLATTDTSAFYFNLHGAKKPMETTGDFWGSAQGSADVVDLLYLVTHSGNWLGSAHWAMWDRDVTADSTRMKLGNNIKQANGGLSVLATHSCNTLATADGEFIARWKNTFAGGLRLTVGGWGFLYDATGIGKNFARRLQNGESFGDAFANATIGGDSRAKPAVASTADTAANCWPRLSANLSNILSKKRFRDSAVGYYCWVQWNN